MLMRRGTYLQRNPDRQLNCPASIPSVLEATATGGCLQPHCDRTRTLAQGRVLRLNSVIGSGRACKGRGAPVMQLACALISPASTDADLLCATACDPRRRVHGGSGGFVTAIAANRLKSPPRPTSDPTRRRS